MDKKQKAVFIDKDGTLIPDIPYNVNPVLIALQTGVAEGLQLLSQYHYQFFIITNQAGVGFGFYGEEALNAVEEKIVALLLQHEIKLSGFYYCPHHPEGKMEKYKVECSCRKPFPGLILQAAAEHNIDLKNSWMIGDILNDVEAGNNAGCRSILVNNGNETEWLLSDKRTPVFSAANFTEAAHYIAKHSVF